MYTISTNLYLKLAEALVSKIGAKEFFSGTVECIDGDVECRLLCTLIVERGKGDVEGSSPRAIVALHPVWWECHTTQGGEEFLNDFSFKEFTKQLFE